MAATEETRLKFIGLLTIDPNLPLRPLQEELGVSYSTLFKWRAEYLEAQKIDEVIDLVQNGPGVYELAKESTELAKSVDSLRLLDTALSATALSIVNVSARMLNRSQLDPRDMLTLANTIATIQEAFFAKGANVNILQYNEGGSNGGLKKFKELLGA